MERGENREEADASARAGIAVATGKDERKTTQILGGDSEGGHPRSECWNYFDMRLAAGAHDSGRLKFRL